MAKFSKGQTVWSRSPWGGYIAEPYTIISIDESNPCETFYYVKGKQKPFKEGEFYETEGEVQVGLAACFKAETFTHLKSIISACRRISCADLAKDKIFNNGQLLLGTPDAYKVAHHETNRSHIPTPKFKVGQTVYGHVFKTDLSKMPVELVVRSAEPHYVQIDDQPAFWEVAYKVKRHGSVEIPEWMLHATMDEALLATIDNFKDSFNRVVYSFKQRSSALGIEAEVRHALQANTDQLLLE